VVHDSSAGWPSFAKLTRTPRSESSPRARPGAWWPSISRGAFVTRSSPRSIDAAPREIGAEMSVRRRSGVATPIAVVMNAMNAPIVVAPLFVCHSPTPMTAASASAVNSCVIGVTVADAIVDFISSRRSAALVRSKRSRCTSCTPCRRTMRQPITFSSTT